MFPVYPHGSDPGFLHLDSKSEECVIFSSRNNKLEFQTDLQITLRRASKEYVARCRGVLGGGGLKSKTQIVYSLVLFLGPAARNLVKNVHEIRPLPRASLLPNVTVFHKGAATDTEHLAKL